MALVQFPSKYTNYKKPIIFVGVCIIVIASFIVFSKINTHNKYLTAAREPIEQVLNDGYSLTRWGDIVEFPQNMINSKFALNGYRILTEKQTESSYGVIIYDVTIFSDNEVNDIDNIYIPLTDSIDKNFDKNYNFFYKNSSILFPKMDLTIESPTNIYTKKYDTSDLFESSKNYLSDKEKILYMTVAQQEVKAALKSPTSAIFPKGVDQYTITKDGDSVAISGFVDADNSFGAKIRNNFVVKIEITSGDKYILKDITID